MADVFAGGGGGGSTTAAAAATGSPPARATSGAATARPQPFKTWRRCSFETWSALAAGRAERAAERASTLRELMGGIKIAVLAPCVKLHVNGKASTAGSADQVDFGEMSRLLESSVLRRFSAVKLLDEQTPVQQDGAYAIFPALKATMGLVQKEVTSRLLGMMSAVDDDDASAK